MGINGSGEALPNEYWQPAAMIDVRVTQYDSVEFCRIKRKRVAVARLIFCPALYQTTVELYVSSANGQ